MPVLDKSGHVIDDPWVAPADADPLPPGRPAIVSLARLRADSNTLLGHAAGLGVRLPPAADLHRVADLLDRLRLVAVEFPIFRDGRGFTLARTLREHYNYNNDIRAVGHVLPDQFVALLRCGVSSVELPKGTDPARWAEALAAQGEQAVPLLRRIVPAL